MLNTVNRSVTILIVQDEFLKDEKATFNLSKFVQDKLAEYIKALKEYRIYMEVDKDDKTKINN